jgi:nicotinamidase/pyrazinamidase
MSTQRVPDHTALLVTDMQRDFLPGGTLPVPGAEALIPRINHYVAQFENSGAPIYFSRDWHPADHGSFRARGGPWPAHCVADTPGAGFPALIPLPGNASIISKGTQRDREGYSAFDGTKFAELLRQRGVQELWVAGVALDYCVRATTLDALKQGLRAVVLIDAVRAVDAAPGDGERALQELMDAGARVHSWGHSQHESRSHATGRAPAR